MDEKNKKIIIVAEDQPEELSALSDKLTNSGFEVVGTSDGEKCLEAVKKNSPDLILLDLVMPRMGGLAVLEELKKDENHRFIPVIVLTNLDSLGDIQKVAERGVRDYLIKSDWDLDGIVGKINDILGTKEK
ncbi:MAG: response regulator [Candidatus Moranbacteria bacterium]|jgi:CheY-like chemotaxis protein|nr:response regulator [Candidatus Moranbacteria bacterium]MDX9855669.1 response regulator [Candidatus Moranbacteria bacterium]